MRVLATALQRVVADAGRAFDPAVALRALVLALVLASVLMAPATVAAAPAFSRTADGGFRIDVKTLETEIRTGSVVLPDPHGRDVAFRIQPASVAHPQLEANHPEMRVWSGQALDAQGERVALGVGPLGFFASVIGPNGAWGIDRRADGGYASAAFDPTADFAEAPGSDEPIRVPGEPPTPNRDGNRWISAIRSSGTELRTYRFALAADGNWSNFVLENSGLSAAEVAELDAAGKKALVHAALAQGVAVLNNILETEVSARLVLVPDNDELIYLDPATDPYPDPSAGTDAFLDPNRTTLDAVIGSANYDLGHVISTVSGGKAYVGVIGDATYKGGGVSGISRLVDDAWITIFAHEVGHQFGGNHTFQGCGQSTASRAFEPGSGSTIMSYAGTCGSDDLQAGPDPFFHAATYDEMRSEMESAALTGVGTPTGNSVPVVSVVGGNAFTIPPRTPFRLEASATDADGPSGLTYSWEQLDAGVLRALDASPKIGGALFRSLPPSSSGVRYLPSLAAVLAGETNASTGTCTGLPSDPSTDEPRLSCWAEFLPDEARTMRFRVSVRDNAAGGGGVANTDATVTVAGSSRFRVTSHTASSTANAGDSATITWDTAGTEGAPYAVDRVDLLLSTDGGFTWDRTLLAATANDGSETIVLPNITAVDARIIVRPVGNVFYAVSDAGISITSTGTPAPPTVVSAVRGAAQATIGVLPGADGGTPTSYQVTSSPDGRTCAIVGASGSCAVTGLTNGVAYTFTAVASNASGDSGVSSPSEPVTPATTPGAATNLAVIPSHETLTVTWSPPASDGGSPITSYYVSTYEDPSKRCRVLVPASPRTCSLTGLTNGVAYSVWIHTYNDVGRGTTAWAPDTVTPRDSAPLAPSAVTAIAGDGEANVSWALPVANGGSVLIRQTAIASPGGASCTVFDPSATSCRITGLDNGTTYTFSVQAANAAGLSPASASSGAVIPATVPRAPTNVTASPSDRAATVSWTPPTSDGGLAIRFYTATASPGGATCIATAPATSCTVIGLDNETTYTFSVQATNAAGISPASASSGAVTPKSSPPPPPPEASPAVPLSDPCEAATGVAKAKCEGTAMRAEAVAQAQAIRTEALSSCAARSGSERTRCLSLAHATYRRSLARANAVRTRHVARTRCNAQTGRARRSCAALAAASYSRSISRASAAFAYTQDRARCLTRSRGTRGSCLRAARTRRVQALKIADARFARTVAYQRCMAKSGATRTVCRRTASAVPARTTVTRRPR